METVDAMVKRAAGLYGTSAPFTVIYHG